MRGPIGRSLRFGHGRIKHTHGWRTSEAGQQRIPSVSRVTIPVSGVYCRPSDLPMYRYAITALLTLALAAATSLPAAGQTTRRLDLRFEADGTVTLQALGVSVGEILAEWARQCNCYVVNATGLTERIPVPLQFERRSQQEVLRSLLRQASGYALTPRRADMAGPSAFETIYVLPTSRASQATYTPPPVVTPSVPTPTMGSPADEIPPVTPIRTLGPPAPQTPEPASRPQVPGTPSRFVPIVPVTPGQQTTTPEQPPTAQPGGTTGPIVTP